jgi:recombination protein RecA
MFNQMKIAIAQIEKNFGKGALMKMGDREIMPLEVIPTGARTHRHGCHH